MPTVTDVDINHAVRRVEELANAIKRHRAGKRLSIAEVRHILACAPMDGGRPREDVESYESLAVASKKMGISIAHLKAMKRMGCPAFRSSRVYGKELREWLDTNPVDEMKLLSPLDMERLKGMRAVRQKHEFQNALKRGEYMLKDGVRTIMAQHITTARSVMHGKGNGLAMILASLTGADPIMIEEKIRARDKEVIAELHINPVSIDSVNCSCGLDVKIGIGV